MSGNATLLLARRSIRARIGRLIAIAVAIVIGVSFVVGSFVLADSLRGGFNSLFTDINSHTDLEVRTKLAFGNTNDGSTRDPLPAVIVPTIKSVAGRGHGHSRASSARRSSSNRTATPSTAAGPPRSASRGTATRPTARS